MNIGQILTPTGNIASIVVQAHFMKVFGLDQQSEAEYANTKGWIVSIATAGAVFGCFGVSSQNPLRENTMLNYASVFQSRTDSGDDGLYLWPPSSILQASWARGLMEEVFRDYMLRDSFLALESVRPLSFHPCILRRSVYPSTSPESQ